MIDGMTFIDTAHEAASTALHQVLTPQHQLALTDFFLHDVLGNIVASLVLAALLALWQLCTKRNRPCTDPAHGNATPALPPSTARNEDTTTDPPSCPPPTPHT